MLLLVTTLFFILLCPTYVRFIYLLFASRDTPLAYANSTFLVEVTYKLYASNSGINFFLYCISGKKIPKWFEGNIVLLLRKKRPIAVIIHRSQIHSHWEGAEPQLMLLFLPPATKLGKVIFSETCVKKFCPQGVSNPRPRGEVGVLAWGCSRPRPSGKVWGVWPGGGFQAHTQRGSPGPHPGWVSPGPQPEWGVYQHALRQTPPPPSRRLLLRAVRILLECILVVNLFGKA